jgi:hypothetical protein
LFYSTNPSEFALRASGISSASDRALGDIAGGGSSGLNPDFTP